MGARLWPQLLCPQLGGHGHGGEEVPHRFQHQPTQHEGASPPHRAQPAGAGPREGPGDPVHQPRGAPPSPSGKGQRPRASAGAVVGGRGTGQTGFGLPPADWPSLRVHSVWGQRRSAGRGWSEAGELRPHGGFPWKKAGLPFVNVAVFPYCWETATSGIPGALRAPPHPSRCLGSPDTPTNLQVPPGLSLQVYMAVATRSERHPCTDGTDTWRKRWRDPLPICSSLRDPSPTGSRGAGAQLPDLQTQHKSTGASKSCFRPQPRAEAKVPPCGLSHPEECGAEGMGEQMGWENGMGVPGAPPLSIPPTSRTQRGWEAGPGLSEGRPGWASGV